MRQSSRPVCGIFNRSQLSQQFVRYAAAAAIAAAAMMDAGCAGDLPVDEATTTSVQAPEIPDGFVGMVVETSAAPVGA
jgi:hypothetical protein